MEHYESKIKVNDEWKPLLIIKSQEKLTFTNLITFVETDQTVVYLVKDIHAKFENEDGYIYQFIPIEKQIIIHEVT